jgi:hypothetical protein
MEEKPMRFADQTWLDTHPQVMDVGDATTVGTIAHLAAVKQIARDFPAVKEGDQIEWKAGLRGRITVDRSMLDAAIEERLR